MRWRGGWEDRGQAERRGMRPQGVYGGYGEYGTYGSSVGPQERHGGYGGEQDYGQRGFGDRDRDFARTGQEQPGREGRWHGEGDRGLAERMDRGPIQWLGDRLREGMRKVGRGPKGYRRSDERMHEDVCERIARSGLDADDVEVKVESSEVTLSGTARSREDKRRLEDLADDVFGVEEVHNHLRIAREPRGEAGVQQDEHLHH
jgi:hypothetical protein